MSRPRVRFFARQDMQVAKSSLLNIVALVRHGLLISFFNQVSYYIVMIKTGLKVCLSFMHDQCLIDIYT